MASTCFVAAVSGGNKGIGLEVVRKLVEALPSENSTVLLGSRDRGRGEEALKSLKAQNVKQWTLDVDSPESIAEAVRHIDQSHGRLDLLVCNAGRAAKGSAFNEQVARETVTTNFFGAQLLVETALPLLRRTLDNAGNRKPRVVFVSSRSGNCGKITDSGLRTRLLGSSSALELRDLGNEFIASVGDGSYAKKGWPQNTYSVSKILMSCLARTLSRDPENEGLTFNACCPGWVRTDMGGQFANLSAEQGADTPVWLSLSEEPGVVNSTGQFFAERRKLDFASGFRPME